MARKKKTLKNRTDTPSKQKKAYENPNQKTSNRSGLTGLIETFLRSFRSLAFYLLMAPIALAYILILGFSFTPGIYLFKQSLLFSAFYPLFFQCLILGLTLALAIIFFWLSMIIVIPIFNLPFLFFVKPLKGTWYSLNVIPWFYHNSLVQLARFTVLDFLAPTHFNLFFYRMMGMKIGKGVVINTSNISDPCLIQLDDYVTIGGSATLFAHYGMKGYLVVARLHIKKYTTIGLKASVMGDVIIGERVMVTPHTVIMPKSRIPDDTMVGLKKEN